MPRVRTIKAYRLHRTLLKPGRVTKVTAEKARELVRTGCFVYHDPTVPTVEDHEVRRFTSEEEE